MAGTSPHVQIGVGVDADGAKREIASVGDAATGMANTVNAAGQRAGKSLDNIGTGATRAGDQLSRAERSMVQSIERATAAFSAGSKSSSEYYRVLAQQRGIDPAILEPYLKSLEAVAPKQKAATDALAAAAPALDKVGMSAKATAAAMRQVPAQFTDIIVSLQGGQAPLTVLLQQGGQLKDIFGGVGAAARALGSYIVGLINPYTVLAAAAAALSVAFYKGRTEAEEFNKALILTNNYAGTSAGALQMMARNVADATGATKGAAADALNAFAASGQVGAAQLEQFASTAVRIQRETGTAVGDTVKQFVALGKDPVAASVKLNETTHYLTLTIYEQIKALEGQGKTAAAAALAQKAYADAQDQIAKKLNLNLGYLETGWRAVADAAKGAWDAMLNIGREDDLDATIAKAQARVDKLTERLELAKQSGIGKAGLGLDQKELEREKQSLENLKESARLRDRAAQSSAQDSRDVEGEISFDKDYSQFLTKELKMKKELTAAENSYQTLVARGIISRQQYDQLLAGIREKYTDKGTVSKQGELDKARAEFDIGKIQKAYEAQAQEYANGEKILDQFRSAGLLDDRAYYDTKARYIQLNTDLQVKALDAEIAREKDRKVTGNNEVERELVRVDIAKKVQDLEAKRTKVLADSTTQSQLLANQEAINAGKISRAYQTARQAAQDYLDTAQQGYQRSLEVFGRGDGFREQVSARAQINDKYDAQSADAQRKFKAGPDTAETRKDLEDQLKLINEFRKKALDQWEEYYAGIKRAEGDWTNGANRAIENYVGNAKNAAKQTEDLFTRAFSSMEDAVVQFAMTGELNFKKFADGVISDLIRIEARKQISKVLSNGFEVSGGVFDFLSSFDGGGPTGDAPRSGGLDGKGGFMAMLHPQETVIDHTKGQSVSAGSVTVIQNINIDSRSDQATIFAAMAQAKDMAKAEILSSRRAGGVFA